MMVCSNFVKGPPRAPIKILSVKIWFVVHPIKILVSLRAFRRYTTLGVDNDVFWEMSQAWGP